MLQDEDLDRLAHGAQAAFLNRTKLLLLGQGAVLRTELGQVGLDPGLLLGVLARGRGRGVLFPGRRLLKVVAGGFGFSF